MNDIKIKSASCPGQHKVNEDFMKYATLSSDKTIVVLADGMGGLSHGDLSATTVVQTVFDVLEKGIDQYNIEDLLRRALIEADTQIETLCKELKCKMGAAVTAVIIVGDTVYYIWQGNVRLYLAAEEDRFELLTKDHVFGSGKYDNTFLTRCVNGKGFRELPPIGTAVLNKQVTLYLCTDGFYQSVAESEINGFDLDVIHKLSGINDDYSLIEIKLG